MNQSQYIKIQNFRCFKEIEVNSFKRVNLIGGKNNTGKTSLLEALLIYFYPFLQSLIELRKIRKDSLETIKKITHDYWNYFFNSNNASTSMYLQGYFKNFGEQKINISAYLYDDISQLSNLILSIIQQKNQEEPIRREFFNTKGILSANSSDDLSPLQPTDFNRFMNSFISSSYSRSNYNEVIAKQYDKIDYDGKGGEVLKILKILDPSIIGLRTYSFAEPTLYIQTETQPRGLPISLFGDAIYRVTVILIELLDQEHKVLFIDEIENGIHYTSQRKLWEGLFTLAEELDTLIFATTHSLEMIKAFAEAGKNFPDQGAYFELAYSPRTDNIVAINRDIDLLEYDLEHGKAIRGE
jgi:hypothetical protein